MPASTAEGIGRLRARGMLKLNQFWPKGQSDADTANITIDLALDPPFMFRPNQGTEKVTRVFHDAHWHDDRENRYKPILGNARNKLRVRLQGIDSPELHYPVFAPHYRQHLAESAVKALGDKLTAMAAGESELRADAVTFVDLPGDAFDIYGRYVGNITVYADGFSVDINHWLLEHGWAVPGIYNSMTEREITVARSLSEEAARQGWGLYKSSYYQDKLAAFNEALRTRVLPQGASFQLYEDAGPLMNPKFYRRQVDFFNQERNNPTGTSFEEHLRQSNRKALLYSAYMQLSPADKKNVSKLNSVSVPLGQLVGVNGTLPKADDLINIEGAADIYTQSGEKITGWDF